MQPIAARQWHSGFLPSRFQGVQFRSKGDAVLYLRNPAGRHARAAAGGHRRGAARSTEAQPRLGGRPGDRRPDHPVRDGVPDADERAGADGPRERAAHGPRDCTAPRRATARSPPTACWPGAWPSAACGSSSSTTATGTTTAASRTTSRSRREEVDQASAALLTGPRSSAACSTTRWSSGAASSAARRWPRATAATTTSRASRCWLAGGGIKGGITHGATDELGYMRGRERGPRPRPARHDAAPARHRPHEADVPLPGPRLPPHRRPRAAW